MRGHTEQLWNFDWADYLPDNLNRDIVVRRSSLSEMEDFARNHFERIYRQNPTSSRFAWFEQTESKSRFYATQGDFIALECRGAIIGMFVGNAIDWSSYYIRNIAILPEWQGRGTFQQLLAWVFATMERIGVDRVEADVSLSNIASLKGSLNAGFTVVGHSVSERWGALALLRKVISPTHRAIFNRQFCHSEPSDQPVHGVASVPPHTKEGEFS